MMNAIEACDDLGIDYLSMTKLVSKGLLHVDHYDKDGSPVFTSMDIEDYKNAHYHAHIDYIEALRSSSIDDQYTRNKVGHLTKEDKQEMIDLLHEIEENGGQ